MMPYSKYILLIIASCFMASLSAFAQYGDEIPDDQWCRYGDSGEKVTDTFYYDDGAEIAMGQAEKNCRLLCGGQASFRYTYWVQLGKWTYLHPNGVAMATGKFIIKSEEGTDNRGQSEIHYYAEKTGKWLYYDAQGNPVKEEEIATELAIVQEQLRRYNLGEHW